MKISVGDYVILDVAKPLLAKVVHAEKPYKAILERDREAQESKLIPVEFRLAEVIANLGKSPRAGSVHGVKVEPLFRTEESKFFPAIRIYQDMSDERYAEFRKEMIVFIKTLKARNLQGPQIELEVRPVAGKYAGYYKFRPKMETDIMCVRPSEALEGMQHIFFHEYGHAVQSRMVPRPIWVKWIRKYHDHVSVTSIDDAELEQLREDIEGAKHFGDYLKECVDESKPVVKACLKYIQQVHGLNKRHLETMMSQEQSLGEVWPSAIELSDKDMVVSDYAEKSPEEFFAECFAFTLLGRKLPPDLATLIQRTLSQLVHAKGN